MRSETSEGWQAVEAACAAVKAFPPREQVTATAWPSLWPVQETRPGLSTPVAALHLSARPASALQMLHIRYVYELVQKSPLDLFRLPNFGRKSLKEIKDKMATLGLTLGMPVEDDSYRAAIVATVAATIAAAKGGAA